MKKYVISVSKKDNSIWKIYFYDENFEIHSQTINTLLIWYYKLIRRHRKKMYCLNCNRGFLVLLNWYDRKIPECSYCSESITDNIIDTNENEDSLGKIVSSALIGLAVMKFKNHTKN